ncbi:MAG: type II toxin-antitoxin system death-on-curing family toxin [Balneolaceae bacterium]|nr:type II toxin-antitoxin system death-on-curing family toxin [Balneolaceae bacterium]
MKFHQDQLDRYGGKTGVRDEKLLESALAQPQASFEGEYVHNNLFHMASAYGFHLCQNHPFYDGNKRTALIAMYTFLYVNGFQIKADKKSLFAIVMDLASGKVKKDELADYLKNHSKKRPV